MKEVFVRISFLTFLCAAILIAPSRLIAVDAATNAPDAAPTAALKFYGPVLTVDTNAHTFTVGDQTFSVTAASQLTKAKDNSAATLADATVGEPARGTYVKGKDGKLEITKVRFGKKAGGGKAGGKKSKKSETTDPTAPATPPKDK